MRIVRVGYRCNNACVFCAQGELRDSEPGLDDASIRARIDAAASAADDLAFVGGEPTLLEGLPAWVAHARSLAVKSVLVQTNGRRLAYVSYARALAEAGVSAVDVSLQGSTAAMHDYHTGTPGSFAQTAVGIGHARAAGIAVGATVVVTRSSYRHLSEIVRVAHARGATAVHFAVVVPEGRARDAAWRLSPAAELVRPHLGTAVQQAQALGMGVLAQGRAFDSPTSGSVTSRFAGIGDIESRPPSLAGEGVASVAGLISKESLVRRPAVLEHAS